MSMSGEQALQKVGVLERTMRSMQEQLSVQAHQIDELQERTPFTMKRDRLPRQPFPQVLRLIGCKPPKGD